MKNILDELVIKAYKYAKRVKHLNKNVIKAYFDGMYNILAGGYKEYLNLMIRMEHNKDIKNLLKAIKEKTPDKSGDTRRKE